MWSATTPSCSSGWNDGLTPDTTLTPDNLAKYGIKTLINSDTCGHVVPDESPVSLNTTVYRDLRNLGAIFNVRPSHRGPGPLAAPRRLRPTRRRLMTPDLRPTAQRWTCAPKGNHRAVPISVATAAPGQTPVGGVRRVDRRAERRAG